MDETWKLNYKIQTRPNLAWMAVLFLFNLVTDVEIGFKCEQSTFPPATLDTVCLGRMCCFSDSSSPCACWDFCTFFHQKKKKSVTNTGCTLKLCHLRCVLTCAAPGLIRLSLHFFVSVWSSVIWLQISDICIWNTQRSLQPSFTSTPLFF